MISYCLTHQFHPIHLSDSTAKMKATMTPESYKQGRNLVKFFTLSQLVQVKGIEEPFQKVKLDYDLDTGMCLITTLSEDDVENESPASILVDRYDYDLTSQKADKYVLEEFIDRTLNVSVIADDFDEF